MDLVCPMNVVASKNIPDKDLKMITVYEVWADNVIKYASVDKDEIQDYCGLYYTNTGVLPDIQEYEREPVDHTKK